MARDEGETGKFFPKLYLLDTIAICCLERRIEGDRPVSRTEFGFSQPGLTDRANAEIGIETIILPMEACF
jgi:hypothetical protein